MANDRLRDSLHANGLAPGDLADELGVDPKTVERWITKSRIPYPRYRHAIVTSGPTRWPRTRRRR